MTQTKNHRPSGVNSARVSDATRNMARPASLLFENLEQEKAFWVSEKERISREFSELRADKRERLKRYNYLRPGSPEYCAEEQKVDDEFSLRKANLAEQQAKIEDGIRGVKLKLQQENRRRKQADPETGVAEDGTVSFSVVAVRALAELTLMRQAMERIATALEGKKNQ